MSPFARFFFSISLFFRVLGSGALASRIQRLSGQDGGDGDDRKPTPAPATLREASPDSALQLLAMLQREGRFIDFVQEDIAGFSDADVGAAARVVHGGARKVLTTYVTTEPIRTEDEGAS